MLGHLAMPVTPVSVPASHSADIKFSNQTGGNPKQVALPGLTHSISWRLLVGDQIAEAQRMAREWMVKHQQ